MFRPAMAGHRWWWNNDVISRFTYLYDPAGNRTAEAREDGDLRVFVYDPTNQLISELRTDGDSWSDLTADQWGNMGTSGWGRGGIVKN